MAGTAGSNGVFDRCVVRIHRYAHARTASWVLASSFAWMCILTAATLLFATLLGPFGVVMMLPFVMVGSVLLPVCTVGALYAPLAWLWAAVSFSRSAVVRIGGALWIQYPHGRTAFPLASLTSARLSSSGGEVALKTHGGDVIFVRLEDPGDAERLLADIASSRAGGTWSARLYEDVPPPLPSRWLLAIAAVVALVCSVVVGAALALAIGVMAGAAAWAVASVRRKGCAGPRVLVVGSDGLSIQADAGEHFIPFHGIERVDDTGLGVQLALTGGEEVALLIVPPQILRDPQETGLSMALAERRREHLLALLRERIGRGAPEAGGAGALLERRGRPARAWRAALRRLVSEAGVDYRTARLTREQAFAVLEDGAAPAEHRIGAALALSSASDGETAARVRIAAESCVNRDVRLALEQAAEGEVAEWTLEQALSSQDAGEPALVMRSRAPTR
ncbi:hypothetical protein [Sorangium sp. So ce131]|uniref:hypothetical protein n=1 Tax=Sorangium sp. So ce131 TaxID=3133282 RepID=UPI003F63ACAA